MKRLLIALLLAFPAMAGPRDWTFYPPHIPIIDPPQVNTFCAANVTCSITGAWTLTNVASLTTASLTDSGLTAGNCVQATTGGLLTTVGSSCGTSSGTVTTTGSPASGNLAKFSGALSVTNADLTGDVTTSGTVATTMASTIAGAKTWSNLGTFSAGITGTGSVGSLTESYANLTSFPSACGANQFATQIAATPGCTQPSFSNLSGTIASAQFGSQSANTFLSAPNGSSGNPTFRTIVGADVPAINLAATGNGGITGNLPVGNIAIGTNGQCINTSGGATVWGSCAGTAGVQVPSGGINTTTVSVSAAVASLQTMQSFSFASGALNTVGKSFRVFVSGTMNPVNTTEVINLGIHLTTGAGGSDDTIAFTPSSTSFQNWRIEYRCSTVTTGATGSILCAVNAYDIVGSNGTIQLFGLGNTVTHSSSDLTGTVSVASEVSFSTASSSNLASSVYMVVEQMN